MKFLFILCFLIPSISFSQSFGIRGGYNLSTVRWVSDHDPNIDKLNSDITHKGGFQIGGNVDFKLSKILSIEPGLNFSAKGYKINHTVELNGTSLENTSKSTIYYLDIPAYFKATIRVGEVQLFGATGPYFGIALDIDGENALTIESHNRYDFGASFAVGAELGRFEIGAFYDVGLKNNNPMTIIKSYNRSLKFSLGYRLGK